MKMIKLLTKMSFKYWLHHKRRLFTLMLTLVLGVGALCCTALLVRSEKQAVFEEELRLLGNYDNAAHNISLKTAERIRQEETVEKAGLQFELGYVQNAGGAKFNAAAFEDKQAQDIYHMTCTRGRYPENADEVAMDVSTAKGFGIAPYPGAKVSISLFSADGKHLADKQYTLCGVFEEKDPSSAGGWYRYPYAEKEYDMPSVYFHISQNDIFKSELVSAFIQTDLTKQTVKNDLYSRVLEYAEDTMIWSTNASGRVVTYMHILGADRIGAETRFSTVSDAVENDDTVKDFYSQILMPLLTVIIFIIVIMSVIGITKNIIQDKQENFAVLRSLGLGQTSLKLYIFCDFTLTALAGIAIGLGLGSLAHIGMIDLLDRLYDLKLQYGFTVHEYVTEVTYDPFILSSAAVLICVELAVFHAVCSINSKTPIQLFAPPKVRTHRRAKAKPAGRYRSWKRLLIRRIKLHNVRIAVVSVLVMGVALFGYTYFCALTDKENNELKWQKEQSGLAYWDYTADRSNSDGMYIFNIENHHDNGVSQSAYKQLKDQSFVKDIYGRAVNRSTRLTFAQGSLDKKALSALEDYDVRDHTDVDTSAAGELDRALKEAEDAVVESIGYDKTDLICSCPSVAFFDEEFEKLRQYTERGEINLDKLRDGSEVLLVMTKTSRDKYISLFDVGDTLPLSDIRLNDTEESLDFDKPDPSKLGEPVYKKNVPSESGNIVPLTSYAVGRRKDLPVKVGAILVLDSDEAKRYMTFAASGNYGLNVFCSLDSFKAWGLPDRNLTQVSMKVKDESYIAKADEYWYSTMSGARGMVTSSTAEISANMDRGSHKIMSVYYCMMIILTLIAAVMIAISLYTDIRMRSGKFAMLRACGMSARQILFMIWRQNIIYPIVGAALSIIPVAACQKLFDYVLRMFRLQLWNHEDHEWTDHIPYFQNLYDYHLVRTIAVIFALYLVMILLVTLPQIRFIRKQSIADEIEKSSF